MKKKNLNKLKKEAKKDIKKDGDKVESRTQLRPETRNSIILVSLILLFIISVFSFFGWAGVLGKGINTALEYLFGWGKYIFPILLAIGAYYIKNPDKLKLSITNYIGITLFVLSVTGFLHLVGLDLSEATSALKDGRGGGLFGLVLSYVFEKAMGQWVAGIVLVFLFLISILIIFDISLRNLFQKGNVLGGLSEKFREFFYKLKTNMDNTPADEDMDEDQENDGQNEEIDESNSTDGNKNFSVKKIDTRAKADNNSHDPDAQKDEQMKMAMTKKYSKVDIPIDLLESSSVKPTSGDINASKEKIFSTLQNFGIDVEMGDTKVGPTVTQYTLKPNEGVKLSQITTLSNDLALALAAHPIRIEAPIPGKSLVGIEVPNEAVAVVKLKEILMSKEFKKRKSNLTIALGKDVAGNAWLADLDPMPHLLVAGATGSGKSVCLNDILISLLYQNNPDQLKMILVDPKRVEMTAYNGIPHLLTPVINQVDKTINALRWVVSEMDRRYELLSKTGHRNIAAYNNDNGNTMPYLVLAIDELADLMSVAANEVEAAIIRLAQMARAVGIHLILATQRPSVDIITGLIKANITNRIAFSVASVIDSRTILDTSGADKLLGRGDLLYISPELSKPKRLQGAYVNDQEIERVLSYWKSKGGPDYVEDITEKVVDTTLAGNFEDMGDDELLGQAKELVINAGKASASFLQRRLRIGYARAARLLDIMEEQGVIGPGEGAKPREILITGEEEYNEAEHGDLPVENEDEENESIDDNPEEDEEDKSV